MIILHASWLSERVHLWAEMSREKPAVPSVRRGRKPKLRKPEPFPYDPGLGGLKAALSAFDSGVRVLKRSTDTACAWLPSSGGLPVASSPLIAEPPDAGRKIELSSWVVTTRPLRFPEVCLLLGYCAEKEVLAHGMVAAADARWFADALRLAGAVVARQTYLPGLVKTSRGFEARWHPALADADEQRLFDLAGRMPASTRCLSGIDAETPPDPASAALAKRFIGYAVDHLVRDACQRRPTKRKRVRKKTPTFDSVHDAWLHGLRSPDAVVPWDDERQLTELARQILDWRRPIELSAHAKYRLCFRLEEPQRESEPAAKSSVVPTGDWHLEFLVQPKEDRSLLVPVGEVWKPRSRKASVLEKHGGDAKEYLLAALGQAAS